jgi:hypothetical protein
MEPSATKAVPRVHWLGERLAECSEVIHTLPEEEISFDNNPIKIDLERTGVGLNDRLFGQSLGGMRPAALQKSIKRTHIACYIKPQFPVPMDLVIKQLSMLNIKRTKRGQFIRQRKHQKVFTFWDVNPNWDK